MITAGAYFRLGQKRGKPLFDLPDKPRSGAAVVLCNETPNID
jgi:hypothetical protein